VSWTSMRISEIALDESAKHRKPWGANFDGCMTWSGRGVHKTGGVLHIRLHTKHKVAGTGS